MKTRRAFLGIISVAMLALSACHIMPDYSGDERYEKYLLAVEAGYEGTYEEWLDTIKGKDGKDGTSVLTGHGAPYSTLGNVGDSYIDLDTWDYYTKTENGWVKQGNIKGQDGNNGQNGVSVISIIKTSSDGLVDTYTITYSDGTTSTFTVTNGADGSQGIQGNPGQNGHTPIITIGDNGHWYVDGVDTGFSAKGEKGDQGEPGENGISIISIEKTSSDGLVDTYTITYSNGTTSTFTVTNGADGSQGIQGESGENGHTPSITIGSDGHWYVDGEDTGFSAKGDKGDQGEPGVSITNTYIDENGDLIVEFSDGTVTNAGHVKDTDKYTVTFHVDDEIIATKEVIKGNTVARPTEEETAGYTINSWYYLDGANKENWKFFAYGIFDNIDLYADFDYNEYTISFIDSKFNHEVDSLNVFYDHSYVLPTISQTGYRFTGWEYEQTLMFDSGIYRLAKDITVNALWDANRYTVTLDANGGNVSSSSVGVIYDSQYNLPTPTRTGYTFLGWYDGNIKVSSSATWKYDANKTFIAKWSNVSATYSFDAGDGYCDIDNLVILFDEDYVLPTPTREGYVFVGWKLDDDYIPQQGSWIYSTEGRTLVADWMLESEYYRGSTPIYYKNNPSIVYGLYPQSRVSDTDLVNSLNTYSKNNSAEENGWYLFNNKYYAKTTGSPCPDASSGVSFADGTQIVKGQAYWFLCEPVEWKILSDSSESYFTLSKACLDHAATDYNVTVHLNWVNSINFYNKMFALNDSLNLKNENDKYFSFLDDKDFQKEEYGFPTGWDASISRASYMTDWALARGAYGQFISSTKSAGFKYCYIGLSGSIWMATNSSTSQKYLGVRPAIHFSHL